MSATHRCAVLVAVARPAAAPGRAGVSAVPQQCRLHSTVRALLVTHAAHVAVCLLLAAAAAARALHAVVSARCSLLASLGTGDSHHPRLAQQQPGAGQARGARSALPRTCTGEGARTAAQRHVSRASKLRENLSAHQAPRRCCSLLHTPGNELKCRQARHSSGMGSTAERAFVHDGITQVRPSPARRPSASRTHTPAARKVYLTRRPPLCFPHTPHRTFGWTAVAEGTCVP